KSGAPFHWNRIKYESVPALIGAEVLLDWLLSDSRPRAGQTAVIALAVARLSYLRSFPTRALRRARRATHTLWQFLTTLLDPEAAFTSTGWGDSSRLRHGIRCCCTGRNHNRAS